MAASRKLATKGVAIPEAMTTRGNCLVSDANPIRTEPETRTSRNEAAKDGRTNRFLYRLASWSVDAPYSWTYLKNRFISIEMTTSAMDAPNTN